MAAIALIAAAVWGIELESTQALEAHHAMPENPLSVSPVPGMVPEGNRLAHVDGCFGFTAHSSLARSCFQAGLGLRLSLPI
jgi:hypothetical protein